MLTDSQKRWLNSQRMILFAQPISTKAKINPNQKCARFRKVIHSICVPCNRKVEECQRRFHYIHRFPLMEYHLFFFLC